MKYRGKIFLLFCVVGNVYGQPTFVRVLVDNAKKINIEWKISSDHGIVVSHPKQPSKKSVCHSVTVRLGKNGFRVLDNSGRMVKNIDEIKIDPCSNSMCMYQDRPYQGSFSIVYYNGEVLLINRIHLEDYLYSVLRTESFPGWPLEMNKVLAIACRSYVISKILESQKSKKPYHIMSTNKHQTYQGYHERLELKRAVDETMGIFLGFNEKPILAMFDICCGGVVPSKKHGINFNHAPYLARDYACKYCKTCKSYQWSAEYSLAEFEHMIHEKFNNIRNVKEVKVHKKDAAGVVQQVLIKAHSGYHYVSGSKLLSLSDMMRSAYFTIQKKAHNIVIKGKGFGHHMGLCQWGARQMVREGCNYTRILSYYYPNTTLMRLYHEDNE